MMLAQSDAPSWIQAIAALFGVCGGFLAFAKWLSERRTQRLLEASRSAAEYVRNLRQELRIARELIGISISEKSIANLRDDKTITLPSNCRGLVSVLFPDLDLTGGASGQRLSLPEEYTKRLRLLGLAYLNNIEIALIPWYYGLADRFVLGEQLKYLKSDDHLLKELRADINGKAYQAIQAFENNFEPPSLGFCEAIVSDVRHLLLYPYCCCGCRESALRQN